MNYASTSNIREVIKFYNLGHKTFETDFSNRLIDSHGLRSIRLSEKVSTKAFLEFREDSGGCSKIWDLRLRLHGEISAVLFHLDRIPSGTDSPELC